MEKVRDIPVDGLYTLKKKDAYKASLVFAEAFYDYPLFKGIIPDDKRMEALSIMFDMDIRYAMRTGGAYALNEELEAVMTWQYHSVQKADIWGYFSAVTPRMFRLIFLLGFKCLNRLQEMFTEIQKQMDVLKVPPDTSYLSSIGIKKSLQGQGMGKKLLAPMLEELQKRGRNVLLCTNLAKNVEIYKHFGFEVLEQGKNNAAGCGTWFMLKKA